MVEVSDFSGATVTISCANIVLLFLWTSFRRLSL